ncbi:winged helix-turn-helix domain-containing protein [Streptomyces sp. WMMC940]|uniref:winged helix-turn-helix domain-containing protein n=1 Tax=Streptomyces sp. WMMC940 TaxID=3015153 RepID=UPI0022B6A9A4|nr:winged helix-turn-helix domain-containing protein [Streptomyces sp. WMMC940]MCZ7459468.1 winged helix-turn-helix domain-containing protein [Streptomyces sp. WMMC940]
MNHENDTVNGRKPTHHDIADVLRGRIDSGALRPGDHMPTQSQLVQEFGVERGIVRQALRLLQEDGLLTHVTRGAPARIAERPDDAGDGEDVRPQPTMVALAPQLAKAFSVPEVRIDALCLTAETLMLALAEPLRLIHEGRIRPESVEVRLLLPDRNIHLAFPTSVADTDEDDLVHQRWLAQRNAQGMVLRHNLQALRVSHGIDVTVAFRALPFTPPVKLYVLNGTEALFAYYTVTRREEEIEATTVEMFDTLGTQSLLFPFDVGNGPRDTAFVEQSSKWFDALWNTIAMNLTLSS